MSDNHKKPDDSEEKDHEREQQHSGTLEKIFTVLSVVLFLALAGFLVWQSFEPDTPASFALETGPVHKRGESLAMEVDIKNLGGDAAKGIQIRGEATTADGQPVEAEATLEWLPGDSKRKVTLIFPADANTSETEVRVTGYEEP